VGARCSKCGQLFTPSRLLFPVEEKNYQDGDFIEGEWKAVSYYLKHCFMLTVFGYSGPKTDVEAMKLLKEGWGNVEERNMEQTEIINRPGSDHDALRTRWDNFIHTHHYDIFDHFEESFLAKHPRRSGEAFWNQYIEAKFISDNPIPKNIKKLHDLIEWFKPLINAENTK
jgi:hypothetical protein